MYVDDNSLYTNESISDLDTLYNRYPNSTTIDQGSQESVGDFESVDDNYYSYNSTLNQTIADHSDFTSNYGSQTDSGDLEYIDNNYTQFDSQTEYDVSPNNYDITNGTLDSSGELSQTDGNYTTINSTSSECNYYLGNETFEDENVSTSGNYYGSYSFENGYSSFVDSIAGNPSLSVINKDSHNSVLHIESNNDNEGIRHDFPETTAGEIEFWVYLDTTSYHKIKLMSTTTYSVLIRPYPSNNEWRYYDGSSWNIINVGGCSLNSWYQVNIDFNYSSHTFDLTVNGQTETGLSTKSYSWADGFEIGTNSGDKINIDGYGQKQYENYTIGDNINPYGKPTNVSNYIDDYEFGYDTSVSVQSEDSLHRKYLRLEDNSGSNQFFVNHTFDSIQTGQIEFYLRKDTITDSEGTLIFYENNNRRISITFQGDDIKYNDGTGRYTAVSNAISVDTWYRIKISPYRENNTFDLYLNGNNKGNYETQSDISDGLDKFRFSTWGGAIVKYDFDSFDFSWSSGYYENRIEDTDHPATINLTSSYQLHLELRQLQMLYSYKTSNPQLLNFSLYNFDTSTYDLVKSDTLESFSEFITSINSSYYNSSNFVKVKFYGLNKTTDFQLQLEELKVQNSPKLEVNSEINTELLDNLVYAYRTNMTQDLNVSIYDFNTSTYYLLNSSNVDSFSFDHFALNSSYHNGSVIKVKFDAVNSSFNNFNLQLDVLKVKDISYLDLNQTFEIGDIPEFLQVEFFSNHKTDILQSIEFSVFNFTSGSWVLINESANNEDFYLSNFEESSNPTDLTFENSIVKCRFYAYNITSSFQLQIDRLQLTTSTKLQLSHSQSFDIRGTWRYKFWVKESGGDWVSSDYIWFDVIEPEANVEMISESPYTTKWKLVGTDNVGTIDVWESDFGSNDWDLHGVDEAIFSIKQQVIQDSYVYSGAMNSNYGSSSDLEIGYQDYYFRSFFKIDPTDYIPNPIISSNFNYYIKESDSGNNEVYNIYFYKTESFDEDTLTWSNMPSPDICIGNDSLLDTDYFGSSGWRKVSFNISSTIDNFVSILDQEYDRITCESIEDGNNHEAYMKINLNKFYQSSNQIYMQTNTLEQVSMRSPNDLGLDLQQGDRIELTFNTTSEEKIDFNLLNLGTTQKSYVISEQGNAVFSDQTVTLDVDADYSIDQLEFSSLFEDTDNLIVKDIRIYRYNESTTKYNYKLDADGLKQVYLPFPTTYNYSVYEQGAQVQSGTITTTDTMQTIEYERIDQNIVYLNYYDENNEHLNFQEFTTYVNYTWDGTQYENKRLSSDIMYADEETQITFRIEDSFDATVKTITKNVQTFIDIDLPVYELKVKNEAQEYVSYSLKNNNTDITKTGNIFSEEVITFSISSADYVFKFTNHEDESTHNQTFTLSDNKIITINSTYYEVYFSLFNYDGLGLDPELFRFYINGARKDFGFNTLKRDVNTLVVKDFFNATLKDTTVDLSGNTEYNLAVEVYNLILNNKYNRTVKIEIIRQGVDIVFENTIPSRSSLSYRFLPDIEYTINIYETGDNETVLESKTVLLDEQTEIVDFGFYSEEYPAVPDFNIHEFFLHVAIVISVATALFSLLVYGAYKYYKETVNLKRYFISESKQDSFNIRKFLH
jgi:hypothetical protein